MVVTGSPARVAPWMIASSYRSLSDACSNACDARIRGSSVGSRRFPPTTPTAATGPSDETNPRIFATAAAAAAFSTDPINAGASSRGTAAAAWYGSRSDASSSSVTRSRWTMTGDAVGPLTATTTAHHEWTRQPRPIVVPLVMDKPPLDTLAPQRRGVPRWPAHIGGREGDPLRQWNPGWGGCPMARRPVNAVPA